MVLGAGGKMGPTLCILAKNAAKKAGVDKRVIAVSRGSDQEATRLMLENDVEVIAADLLDKEKLYALPEVENIIYMVNDWCKSMANAIGVTTNEIIIDMEEINEWEN